MIVCTALNAERLTHVIQAAVARGFNVQHACFLDTARSWLFLFLWVHRGSVVPGPGSPSWRIVPFARWRNEGFVQRYFIFGCGCVRSWNG